MRVSAQYVDMGINRDGTASGMISFVVVRLRVKYANGAPIIEKTSVTTNTEPRTSSASKSFSVNRFLQAVAHPFTGFSKRLATPSAT
jgi:hypothetical protein